MKWFLVGLVLLVGCGPVTGVVDAGVDGGGDAGGDARADDKCYQGNYTINDSSDMNFFKSYSCITGNLAINVHDDVIVDLPSLSSVGMSFYVHDNDDLATLAGLGSLGFVGEDLWVINNPTLPDCEVCDFIDQLEDLTEALKVHNNLDDACTPVPDGC